ncbi:uncharacterized protein PAC_16910 [Phialocephala subalpina]|uniref:Heterokaryon incompatibility domain-containing protein n=1 Tax=Phialocephala subalpina TaxID=576137 RepID=A0A1L7XPN2_9HELO|nr:uncharacterized protein PAC_16910 [Phialocephala subalpina]
MSNFRYTPLRYSERDLRLVRIEHGQEDEPPSCSIVVFSPEPHQPHYYWYPKYEALSYTWGDASIKFPMFLNGKLFMATRNLERALRSLRCTTIEARESQLLLWIDALCINQEDADERDDQVRRMKTIYQRAARVLVWLGDYFEPSDALINLGLSESSILNGSEELIQSYSSNVQLLIGRLWDIFSSQERYWASVALFQHIFDRWMDEHEIQTWILLARLFHRSWFERLKISVAAASQQAVILWGRTRIGWPELEGAARYILRPGSILPAPHISKLFPRMGAHRVTQVALSSMLNVDTENIITVLHNTQGAMCTDPRDRLFAILGIVDASEASDVEIDYSLPVQDVYCNWAQKRIQRVGGLDILNACANSALHGLPSWVPDLRRPFGQDKALWSHTTGDARFYNHLALANIRSRYLKLSFVDSYQLSMNACIIGSIAALSTVGDIVTGLSDPTDIAGRLREVITTWKAWVADSINSHNLEQPPQFPTPTSWTFQANIMRGIRVDDFDEWLSESRAQDSMPQDMRTKHRSIERLLFPCLHRCQLFLTNKCHDQPYPMGSVAFECTIVVGDQLCQIPGCVTPFIIRKDGRNYRLITPCYSAILTGRSENESYWELAPLERITLI